MALVDLEQERHALAKHLERKERSKNNWLVQSTIPIYYTLTRPQNRRPGPYTLMTHQNDTLCLDSRMQRRLGRSLGLR